MFYYYYVSREFSAHVVCCACFESANYKVTKRREREERERERVKNVQVVAQI